MKKNTKKSLLFSVLALILCTAMLLGTTFAWFTDSASTKVNTIQAGTLDVQLLDASNNSLEGKTLAWQKAEDHESDPVLWEPGCIYKLQPITIKNNGNLALKYKIEISGIDGDAKLNEAIEWTISGDPIGDDHSLAVGASDTLTISGHMKESAGNEYQGLSIDGVAITVVATQDTVEFDSNNDQYDANAQYPVMNSEQLEEAITTATQGSIVTLTPGTFTLPQSGVPEGVTISGDGADKTTVEVPATPAGNNKTGLVVDDPNVTISGVTISGNSEITSNEYCGFVDIREGGTTLDGVVINNSGTNASSVVIKNGVGAGETVTLVNSTFNGGFKPIDIVDGANGTVVIDNCEITGTYTLNVNSASSQNLVLQVSNSKLHGWTSYGNIQSASFTNTEFSQGGSGYNFMRPYADTTLTNCTFDDTFKLGAGATGKTYVITDCIYNGTALTADNVQALLLDMTGDDGQNLPSCTIIVNGVPVTLS